MSIIDNWMAAFFVIISGRPIPLKTAPNVALIDLVTPNIHRACIVGTMGIHFSPRKVTVNSGDRINIAPPKDMEIKEVICNALRYASFNLLKSSCKLE